METKVINETIGATLGATGPPYWLATNIYSDAPRKKPSNASDGTIPPIPEDFKSPWVSCGFGDIVAWLKAKPEDAGFNPRFFAVLDQGAKIDDSPTVLVCRIGDWEEKGDKVFSFRFGRKQAVDYLGGVPQDVWDEMTRQGHGDAEIRYDDDTP